MQKYDAEQWTKLGGQVYKVEEEIESSADDGFGYKLNTNIIANYQHVKEFESGIQMRIQYKQKQQNKSIRSSGNTAVEDMEQDEMAGLPVLIDTRPHMVRLKMGDLPYSQKLSCFDLFLQDKKTGSRVLKPVDTLRKMFLKMQGIYFFENMNQDEESMDQFLQETLEPIRASE